ncbi:MAG: hypothetical protein H8D45_32915 [Bacteroidetes bacterium]|nr:hypothetical protein [Bacteroidota bacterium]
MFQKRIIIGLVIILLFLPGCLGSCLASNSEGGFWDFFTGNSLTRDKEANRHEEEIQAERTRLAEADADLAKFQAVSAQAQAEKAHAEALKAQSDALTAQQIVQLEMVKGDNYQKRAVARALDAQTLMFSFLQIVVAVFALFGAGISLGIGGAWLKDRYVANK